MSIVIVTGSQGLVGYESSIFFAGLGFDIVGIDNDMRSIFFGRAASTAKQNLALKKTLGRKYHHQNADIRDTKTIEKIYKKYGSSIKLTIHAAAQPSHDWAARDPLTDFSINAAGTLNLLEAARNHAPKNIFIYLSTNKVYGDAPNRLPLIEKKLRFEIDPKHTYCPGIREDLSIDQNLHSLFGVSKASADLLVQEYGRYFGIRTACFRCGCITGPRHSGAELHGFLAYLMKCAALKTPYTVFGYKGKQVRDNIHARDLIKAFYEFFKAPRHGEVYNIGGGRFSNCSMLEAIDLCAAITRNELPWRYNKKARIGDHKWWVSDNGKFSNHYPSWHLTTSIKNILQEIYEQNIDQWEKQK